MKEKISPVAKLESHFQELEDLLKQLDSKTLNFADSLTLYERGVHLVNTCQTILSEAEKKVQQMTLNDPNPKGTPDDYKN